MKFATAAFVAASCSGLALVVCLAAATMLLSDVRSIWLEFDAEIGVLRVGDL
jgi:hypothetical protein